MTIGNLLLYNDSMFKRFNQHYFDLLWVMTVKEFTVRYKQAFFGFLWILLNPFLQMVVIGTIFSFFMKIPNYFSFLFSGLLPWQFFSLSLNKTTPSFVFERTLLQKSVFPREIIPLSIVLSNFINLLISELLLISIFIFISPFSFSVVPYLIIANVWILFFTLGLSLSTSSLNVRFRDTTFFIQTLITIWFYATPILYAINILPQELQFILHLNPLTTPFSLFHVTFLNHPLPAFPIILSNALVSIITFIIGIIIYNHESQNFTDWL